MQKEKIQSVQTQKVQTKSEPAAVDYNQRKILQLGAYMQKENADLEWKMLRQLYPELQNKSPKIERAEVNGQMWYRLIVESEDGGWVNLCEKLKNDRFGCILR